MCGRFTLRTPSNLLVEHFLLGAEATLRPRYNIAPTQPVAVVRRRDPDGTRELSLLRWGLIPSWSRGPDSRYAMINARWETVESKPAYRLPFRQRRCIVPADGFYEWKPVGRVKQPYCITRDDGSPLALAGLWDVWKGPDGDAVESCTIIVTPAEGKVRRVHDRMPLMLSREAWNAWLDPALRDADAVVPLMELRDRNELAVYPVSTRVNRPVNDGPELMTPLEDAASAEDPRE